MTVNAEEGHGTIPSTGYGLNSAVWDSQMNVPQVQNLLQQAGMNMLRYPGGSYGDIYNWQDNTAPGGYVAPGTDFDSFMGTVKKIGAQPILIANYGSGTPQEAAGWVQYANITKGYGVKYWEIGNEVYGNGYYGNGWETDDHASKSPATYAQNVIQYASAMKAVDPSIKIGAVVTLPGNWPDSVVGSGDDGDWNKIVLSAAGSAIDFVIVHWYPSPASPAGMLGEPAEVAGELAQLRQEIDQYAGPEGPRIQIAMTEVNSGVDTTTQPDALFGADTYMTALENGVFTVDLWDTHNGATSIGVAPDGATDYDDWGVLSSATCVGSTCEPPLNTPFPTYFAIAMLSKLGLPGDVMVGAGTDNQLVAAHAVRNADGDLSVMLVNKDPTSSYQVSLHYAGFTPAAASPIVYSYGDEGSAITSATQGTASSQVLPPYSIETIVLQPQGGSESALSAPGAPSASNVTGTQATISWSPASSGPVDKYEVYRQNGTDSELLGTSTSDSFTVNNLVPGDWLHAQCAGPGPEGGPVGAVGPGHVHHEHPGQLYLPGHLRRHPGLGHRVRRKPQHHRLRPGPDRRLDARVHVPGQLRVVQQRLERQLERQWAGGHGDQPGLERHAGPGRRQHRGPGLGRCEQRRLSFPGRVHPQRHGVHNDLLLLNQPGGAR